MLALFRTNQSYASLLLFFYALLLQLPLLWQTEKLSPEAGEDTTYFGQLLIDSVGQSWLIGFLLPPLLLAVTGILANAYCDRQRLSRIPTQFPGLMVVLLWGLVPTFHAFDPQQIGLLLLVMAVGALGGTYKSKATDVARFNVGFLLGLASLLQPSYLMLVPAFLLGISIFQSGSVRRFFQLFVGVLIVYFLAGTYVYLAGDLKSFTVNQLSGFGFGALGRADLPNLLGLGALALVLLVVVFSGRTGRALLTIAGSKNVAFQYWLLLFCLPVALLTSIIEVADAMVLVVPLGVLTGLWLDRQSHAPAEVYHLLYFVGALTLGSVYLLN